MVEDTDEDGLDDYEEIILGLNPLNKASKGVADNLYTLEQTVKADNEIFKDINKVGSPYSFSATGKVAGLMERRLSVRKSGYTNVLQSDSIVGDILDISYDENVKMENMSIQFKVENGNCKDYYIFKYNQEVNMLLPFDVEYNEEEKIIYSPNIEIGTYALVDIVKFSEDMGLNESSEEIILSKDNVLATTEDVPDNIISYKPIDLVFALHSRGGMTDYEKNKESIKFISKHVLSCMPNARIAIVDFNEHQEYPTQAWSGECKCLTNEKGDIWAITYDDVEKMLDKSIYVPSTTTYYQSNTDQAFSKIIVLNYRPTSTRYVVSFSPDCQWSQDEGTSMLSQIGYKVVDVGYRWKNDVNKIGERMDKIVVQNGGIVKNMNYLDEFNRFNSDLSRRNDDLEEVKNYITGTYASGMFGESVKLKRKLTAEDFEVYNKWVSGAISRSDFSKYNLTDSDGDGLYDIEEIDMRFVRMENGVVYLPTIMDLINKTSNATYWSKFSGAMKNQGKNISNLEKKQVITYISKPDEIDVDDDKIPDLDDEKPSEYTSLPNYFIVYDPDRPFIYRDSKGKLSIKQSDFLRQGEWMKKYAYDNKNCETIIVGEKGEFVDAWNQIPKYAGNIHLFLHGEQRMLAFFDGEILAQDLIGQGSDEYCIDDKIIQNKVYLYSCHGGDENHVFGSPAESIALKINGASVIAARDDSVNYANFEIKIDKELDDVAITGNELVDAYMKLQLKINLNITLNIYDRFELYPILQNGEDGIGTWIEVYYNKLYEILQTNDIGKKWRL